MWSCHVCWVLRDLDLAHSVSQFGAEDHGQVEIMNRSRLKGHQRLSPGPSPCSGARMRYTHLLSDNCLTYS